jgi:hypothetical protein
LLLSQVHFLGLNAGLFFQACKLLIQRRLAQLKDHYRCFSKTSIHCWYLVLIRFAARRQFLSLLRQDGVFFFVCTDHAFVSDSFFQDGNFSSCSLNIPLNICL